jgi:hypothetical protein
MEAAPLSRVRYNEPPDALSGRLRSHPEPVHGGLTASPERPAEHAAIGIERLGPRKTQGRSAGRRQNRAARGAKPA